MKHVRIISPSGAIEPNYINRAKQKLESWGFLVSIGKHAYDVSGRFAGSVDERLADLNEAFADHSIDVILCSRGGYGLQQIIDRIKLPLRPKSQWPLVVGFSDITALHALMSLHGVPSLHAPMCKALATLPDDSLALLQLRTLLDSPKNSIAEPNYGHKVIGGNLSVIYGLQGTPYALNEIIDRAEDAPILLIEDICEAHYHIDRMLNNLRLSGVLSRLSGVIVGQFTNCEDDPKMGCTVRESIRQTFEQYHYPITWDAPHGHEEENQPIYLSLKI